MWLQVTGLLPVFNNVLGILRAISTVLLMDAANDYLSVLRTNTGATYQDSAVFFAGEVLLLRLCRQMESCTILYTTVAVQQPWTARFSPAWVVILSGTLHLQA